MGAFILLLLAVSSLGPVATDASKSTHLRPLTNHVGGANCTTTSLDNIPPFTLTEYQIDTLTVIFAGGPAGGTTQSRATLSIQNPLTHDTYRLYHMPVSVTGGVWSLCRAGEDSPLPPELMTCQYLIERRSRRIGFRLGWACNGEDDER